ncbi:hypothetical protein AKJ51_04385 [candidate division MSBL1 archaeon SCGC-AAA382A20]|uniref:Ribbon-helix-helix protein CopG domain-containing protein n=1 Tax=candidate division MSBL1 archaeon SCGC-AAA382A20 TaxID=1698280 RepID=A0A133VHQ3_9EURY|nr:hypothetical protein AKJ51_04385 [candidate division MSBL1 archaeon SCGC-AAA382A20]
MTSEREKLHERMSVSLDLESVDLLEKLQTEYQTSKSEIVRKSLHYLDAISKEKKIPSEDLKTIIKFISRPDNIIIDVSLIETILEETNQDSEELKKEIRNIGREIYVEYFNIGIKSPTECLKTLEKTNILTIAASSNNNFTLISTGQKMNKILKPFLEGLLEKYYENIQVKAEHGKIRIKEKEEREEKGK